MWVWRVSRDHAAGDRGCSAFTGWYLICVRFLGLGVCALGLSPPSLLRLAAWRAFGLSPPSLLRLAAWRALGLSPPSLLRCGLACVGPLRLGVTFSSRLKLGVSWACVLLSAVGGYVRRPATPEPPSLLRLALGMRWELPSLSSAVGGLACVASPLLLFCGWRVGMSVSLLLFVVGGLACVGPPSFSSAVGGLACVGPLPPSLLRLAAWRAFGPRLRWRLSCVGPLRSASSAVGGLIYSHASRHTARYAHAVAALLPRYLSRHTARYAHAVAALLTIYSHDIADTGTIRSCRGCSSHLFVSRHTARYVAVAALLTTYSHDILSRHTARYAHAVAASRRHE